MKKAFVLLAILLFNNWLLICQTNDTIYGNVKSIREQVKFYGDNGFSEKVLGVDGNFDFSGLVGPDFMKTRFYRKWAKTRWLNYKNYYKEYNELNNLVKEIWRYQNGDTATTINYRYDKYNNKIYVKECSSKVNCDITNNIYNDRKLVSSIKYNTADSANYEYKFYVTDSLSNILESVSFDETGDLRVWQHTFDNRNRKISTSMVIAETIQDKLLSYSSSDSRICKENIYDKKGNLVETIHYDCLYSSNQKNTISLKVLYEFDDKNLLTKTSVVRFLGEFSTGRISEYYYNKDKVLVKKIKYLELKPENKEVFNYGFDNTGNIVSLTISKQNMKSNVEFQYEFDAKNNWIEQIKIVDGIKIYAWSRKIKYQ